MQHPSHDFRRLGIFSLYCIAIGLQDKANQHNVNVFNDDDVLRTLTQFARDKAGQKSANVTGHLMVQRSDEIANAADTQELQKLRIVALQILVIICEF